MNEILNETIVWTEKFLRTDVLYLIKSIFWWTLSRGLIALFAFFTMFALANWVPKEIFGSYEYILSIVALLAIFTLPGMQSALIRASAKGKDGMLVLCTKTKLKGALIASTACFGAGAWYLFNENYNLGYSFLIAAIFLPFTRIFSTALDFLIGKKSFDLEAKYSIVIDGLEAILFIPVLFLTNNLVIIILAYFITRSIFPAVYFLRTKKFIQNQETDKETIPFGKHLTFMQTMGLAAGQLDKIIIWQYLGPIAVATYAFAWEPIQRAQTFIPVFMLALPKLSQKNFPLIKKELFQKFLKTFLFSVPVGLVFIFFAPIIYKTVFPLYIDSVPYAQALAIILMLTPFHLLNAAFVAAKKTRELYIVQFSIPLLRIILFLILVPFWGIWGIVFPLISTALLGGLINVYLFHRTT